MDDLLFRSRLNSPLVTGTPSVERPKPQINKGNDGSSFQEILEQRLNQKHSLSFSKHAVARIEERSLELSEDGMERLREGIELAQQKGLDDTLIIVDKMAFIVSAKNSKIITAMGGNDLKGSVITNITGTVIV